MLDNKLVLPVLFVFMMMLVMFVWLVFIVH